MTKLFQSRKFLTMLVDLVVSLATFFITKYAAPDLAKDVLFVIGSLQPVVIAMIASVAVEDAAAYKAGAHPNQNKVNPQPPAG